MAEAEGKKIPFVGEEHIDAKVLESFPYVGPKQRIVYTTHEFSAVCPYSGLPDIATVIIEYVPNELIVELKSLKYYFLSYRSVGIYQEPATARIYKDLFALLKPLELKVSMTYNTRGGIDATTSVNSLEQ
ncbi:MAG: NADPH-dependent 7-cyano-7-deazaguanine reductase QueF [Proteobacteria bacterium]|nr:NADPH-dependent 7-cyano-7-deazaguanine reductase QueF [Pseudomonadota bacterium]